MTLKERKMRKEGMGLACPLVAGPGISFEYWVFLGFGLEISGNSGKRSKSNWRNRSPYPGSSPVMVNL